MDNVKVSIIIPVYNVEQYLRQCLDSVVNQTLKDIEIICIDDGSSDSSLEILHEYSSKDSRIKIITQQHEGAGAARNKGLAVANGKYLSFLDSDDFFETDMLEQMYNCSEKYNTDIVICKSNTFDNGNIKEQNNIKDKLLPNKEVFSSLDIPKYAFQFHMGWCWDKLYKTSFIRGLGISFQNLKKHNDAFFSHISMINAKRIYVLNKKLIYYRNNLSSSISQMKINEDEYIFLSKDFLEEIKKYLIENKIFGKFKQSYVNYCMFSVINHFKYLSFKEQNSLNQILGREKHKKNYFYLKRYYYIYIISSYKILILLYNLVSFHKRYF
jgi:glycosyltransferase involved in cell wall biosynthesis